MGTRMTGHRNETYINRLDTKGELTSLNKKSTIINSKAQEDNILKK